MLSYENRSRAFDPDDLLDLVAGDAELLREVATLGAEDIVRLLAAIDEAPTAFAMAELAHELKGVLLNLTAASAASLAAAIERAARSGDHSAAHGELARTRTAIDEVASILGSIAAQSWRAAS